MLRGIVNQTNGAPILHLDSTCTSTNGGATGTGRMVAPPTAPTTINPWIIVGHLTIGKTYRCTATATNSRGTGIKSKPAAGVTV